MPTYEILIAQLLIIFVLISIIIRLLIFNHSLALEKRLSFYAIEADVTKLKPLSSSMLELYRSCLQGLSKLLKHSVVIKKRSQKYEKYLSLNNIICKSNLDFISQKIIFSFIFVLLTVVAYIIRFQTVSWYELLIPLIIGFYAPNLYYYFLYRKKNKQIENDLLQAIIIMNNAFKSGRSITQAVAIVSEEIDGIIGEEFKKMNMEIALGLDLDIVFKRFYNRTKLEEIAYLTSSLTILNKTGGNIIKVFSAIEKSIIAKRRLKIELQTLTSNSKMITKFLLIAPLVFILLINMIDPNYFLPFFTEIGLILLGVIILIYISFAIFVTKLMKVRL